MTNNFLTTIRSLKLIEGCKAAQFYAFSSVGAASTSGSGDAGGSTSGGRPPPPPPQKSFSLRSASLYNQLAASSISGAFAAEPHLPCGLPVAEALEPALDACLRPVDHVSALAASFRRVSAATTGGDDDLCDVYLEQHALFHSIGDARLLRRALRAARVHADDPHRRVVLAAWLRYERREDELEPTPPPLAPCTATTPLLECPLAAVFAGVSSSVYPVCPCRRPPSPPDTPPPHRLRRNTSDAAYGVGEEEETETNDLWFIIGEEEVACERSCIAALSKPLNTLLYGGFAEAQRDRIDFTRDGITPRGMRAIAAYSRHGQVDDFPPDTIPELLAFSNKFCCEGLKAACDDKLGAMVRGVDDALSLIDLGLEEAAHLLVAACLQAFLRELPKSLTNPDIARLLCSPEGRECLDIAGNASFALYYFLSSVAMEQDMRSNTTVMLLERLYECAELPWQKQLTLHQLGCVMLERGEFEDAQGWFEDAIAEGHVYSLAGVARAKYKRGHKYSAYKLMNSVVGEYDEPAGWMYQERSLYCVGKEKMPDLQTATELDPTLTYPYKYRAVALLEEDNVESAIAEISKVLGFKMVTHCLELRAWFYLALEEYESAVQDVRAILTLDPTYMMFHGKMHGEQLIELLRGQMQQWDMADCWMQLYDRWSAVDDIGSLAVVQQMLTREPGNSSLRFRQSLLLLRLNCQKAAMRSLRFARNCSLHEHERLVYEGWILYDSGHRDEALAKAEQSIRLQRSFEAFFLKAYALGDSSLDKESALSVVQLLEHANSCASDNLRKGQAYNNMGSIYVDCDMLDEAAECYGIALNIKHTRAHQGLARVHYLKNRKAVAFEEMTELVKIATNSASAYEKRSEYGDGDNAKTDLNTATLLDPTRTYPYRYRAAVLMDENKEEEAIGELSQAIAFKPDLQLIHLRAAFFDSMGDNASTLRDCEAALCLDPAHGDTLELYSKASMKAEPQS
ncbi:ethylene-overproduction protein 1-like [Phragmites australis]|uniref:ethylene-overproduction protein 1-like n=1 Tax=Phragmites australis TaxID=29695 RepID=UPI002D783294|nr:ethylene-overproduction protein 1-like [Phragmites australis]